MAKKKKQEKRKSWCWYCDREFEDDKILFQHQRMKHFQCYICHRKLNSASGLVIHMAQVHKETVEKVPNAVDGHDSPELEIYGMDGVPAEDLQRHYDGLPIVPYTKSKLIIGDASILPILAAQKVSVAAQLAESKNMTVQGDLSVTAAAIVSPTASTVSAVSTGASAGSGIIVSPPTSTAVPVTPPVMQADYWNNPYYMAAYYQQYAQQQQQQQQVQAGYQPNPYSQPYSQYYGYYATNYYNAQPSNNPAVVEPEAAVTVAKESIVKEVNNPVKTEVKDVSDDNVATSLIIPPYIDPKTNKPVPGTIFTVLSIDQSMEELRSELKRYKMNNK